MKTARMLLGFLIAAGFAASAGAVVPIVTNIVATQRASTKLVDIDYSLFDADGGTLKVRVEVSDNGGGTYSVPAFSLTGDIGDAVTTGALKHIVWNAGADWDGEYSDKMRVKVIASDIRGYPGMEWGREVPPGGFLMGQDGGAEGSGPSKHVNIPWSYWFSKYELRNDQYCDFINIALVAGRAYREGTTEVRAETGQYPGVPGGVALLYTGDSTDIRWNVNNFEVVGGRSNFPVRVTWYGAMAFAKHYGYDLPTEAEWEKAARGATNEEQDTHLIYPWGNVISGGNARYGSSSPTNVGAYKGNQIPIGPDMANSYGLYDIAGNVSEWSRSAPVASVEDYPAADALTNGINIIATAADREYRGGDWNDSATGLRCFVRNSTSSGSLDSNQSGLGCRLVRRSPDYTDPLPMLEISESFDGAQWTQQLTTPWTIVAPSGTWRGPSGSSLFVIRDSSLARSGTGLLKIAPSYGGYVEFPTTVGAPVGVVIWARRSVASSSGVVYLQEYDGTGWNDMTEISLSSPSYEKARLNVVLAYPQSGQKFRLYAVGVCLDDCAIYTVPRN